MITRILPRRLLVAALGLLSLLLPSVRALAVELLVADRAGNAVYRYDADGNSLGALVAPDSGLLDLPTGIAVSPDKTKLYVSNFNSHNVVVFDYDYAAGSATNPQVFASMAEGIAAPNSIRIAGDGTIYVSNLGGTGVARFNPDGSSAGAALAGGAAADLSGMDFDADGNLLVAGFSAGSVAKSNAGKTALEGLVAPNFGLTGASGVLAVGNDLYVVGMFTGSILKFDATTGVQDPGFAITDLVNEFPQQISLAPDGNGFLVGVLGFDIGLGRIARYGFDGTNLGVFAGPSIGGFQEATAFALVPEPASVGLLAIASVALILFARRRRGR